MIGYPFDPQYLVRNKRAIKRELKGREGLIKKRIALLSGTTIGEIKGILELFLLDNGIEPEFFTGEYGRFYEDVVFDDGGADSLSAFKPDVIYIHTSVHNLREMPRAGEGEDACSAALDAAFERFCRVWSAAERYHCPVIQDNFEYPAVRVMGNFEAVSPSGKVRFVRKLNERIADYAYTHSGFYVNDLNYLSARYGVDRFCDPTFYSAYKYSVSPDCVPILCHSVASIVKSLFGKNKKALMLDLDNTLWKGVIGDDGVEGIKLGIELPEGMAYSELQGYAKELSGVGVVLGVCSKNEEDAAKSGFTHPSSVLKAEDFSTFKANWDPKPLNLKRSAEDLNLGVDSFVFVDDNPAEREIVRGAGLGVETPEIDCPETYARTVADAGYFEITSLSADDLKRAEMYRENSLRAQQQAAFSDYGDYLRSLEMKGYIEPFSEGALERITQLANKTNQFNLTTRRYTEDEMRERMNDPSVVAISGRLIDKFGDNGIVSELIATPDGDALDIELWIMSCRVFKRGLEDAMFDELVRAAKALGIKRLTGRYLKTAKNAVVSGLYGTMGFTETSRDGDDTFWEYHIPGDYRSRNEYIEVVRQEGAQAE